MFKVVEIIERSKFKILDESTGRFYITKPGVHRKGLKVGAVLTHVNMRDVERIEVPPTVVRKSTRSIKKEVEIPVEPKPEIKEEPEVVPEIEESIEDSSSDNLEASENEEVVKPVSSKRRKKSKTVKK